MQGSNIKVQQFSADHRQVSTQASRFVDKLFSFQHINYDKELEAVRLRDYENQFRISPESNLTEEIKNSIA